MKSVNILAATGMLGTGFSEESLMRALENKPDMIGCDAGSTDPGPFYLGSDKPMVSRDATKRDLKSMLKGAVRNDIPLLIGSAGTAGSNAQVDWTVNIVQEIAEEENLSFKMASIYSELTNETLLNYFKEGKIKPLENAPDLDEETITRITRVVGQMGPQPYIAAVNSGAQVIIAGRSSDTSIYAAVPMKKGLNTGSVWHASKILECGAGCVENRTHPDCMFATIAADHFIIEPPNRDMKCTPVSVLSHLLYENADPYQLVECTGRLDTSDSEYVQVNERGIKVSNSRFEQADRYTIRLEGVEKIGYRRVAIGGVRDPFVLRQLNGFLNESSKVVKKKVQESLGLAAKDYELLFRVYGDAGVMAQLEPEKGNLNHEVGVLIEIVAETPGVSESIMSIAWHTVLHHPIKEWSGLVSNLAFPFSPPDADMGPVYRFALNHVVEIEDPCELFRTKYLQV